MASLSLALEFALCPDVCIAASASRFRRRRRRHFFAQVICVFAVEGVGGYQQRHSQQRRRGGVGTLGLITRRCSRGSVAATSRLVIDRRSDVVIGARPDRHACGTVQWAGYEQFAEQSRMSRSFPCYPVAFR